MNKLLFELIMSNQCNKRCPYCKLDFKNKNIEKKILDNFGVLLRKSSTIISSCIVNFFGGEPLLNYEGIKYFVGANKDLDFIKYSIGTNGILLDKEKLDFFIENNFKIHLSIDSENIDSILGNEFLKEGLNNIEINYIIEPDFVEKSFDDFEKIIHFGFRNINIMPVYFTIPRNLESLNLFKIFIKTKVNKYMNSDIKISFFSYFNGETIDKQYIIDTDANIYGDIDSLLWIQKQGGIIGEHLTREINNITKIGKIGDLKLEDIIKKYDSVNIINLIKAIPVKQGFYKTYAILNKIMNG